ncbi:Uncharacterized protein Fot_25614 [Forsythia ovata]|uniref:Uncharacterized protein n=1 Tax=Forsythia ovata TaxID=205694 RepID=A0ABD1U9P1_9LAMI
MDYSLSFTNGTINGLKKSRSIAIVARQRVEDAVNRKKKGGFWSKLLLRSTGKKTKVAAVFKIRDNKDMPEIFDQPSNNAKSFILHYLQMERQQLPNYRNTFCVPIYNGFKGEQDAYTFFEFNTQGKDCDYLEFYKLSRPILSLSVWPMLSEKSRRPEPIPFLSLYD